MALENHLQIRDQFDQANLKIYKRLVKIFKNFRIEKPLCNEECPDK